MSDQRLVMSVDHLLAIISLLRPDGKEMLKEFEMLREFVRSRGLKSVESSYPPLHVQHSYPNNGGGQARFDTWIEYEKKGQMKDAAVDSVYVYEQMGDVTQPCITLSFEISSSMAQCSVMIALHISSAECMSIEQQKGEEFWTMFSSWDKESPITRRLIERFPETEFATEVHKVKASRHRALAILGGFTEIVLESQGK